MRQILGQGEFIIASGLQGQPAPGKRCMRVMSGTEWIGSNSKMDSPLRKSYSSVSRARTRR
jgi:hypothetical protein